MAATVGGFESDDDARAIAQATAPATAATTTIAAIRIGGRPGKPFPSVSNATKVARPPVDVFAGAGRRPANRNAEPLPREFPFRTAVLHYSEPVEERTTPEPLLTDRVRSQRFRAGAVIVLAVVVGLILWLVLRGGNDSSTTTNSTAASEQQLKHLASSLGHPIYWMGPQPGYTYELFRGQDGSVHVRYLPAGAEVGSDNPYLTVATYPFANPYQALKNLKGSDIVFVNIPKGGIAEYTKKNPNDLHAAYPGLDYQIEVFDPSPGAAMGELVSGQLAALGKVRAAQQAAAPKPVAATAAGLASAARQLGHPIYWVGPKRGNTYEFVRGQDGSTHVRYLPAGVKLGTSTPYLVVATYPFKNAYNATKALTKQKSNEEISTPGGGVAVFTKSYPQDVHLAYPKSDYQIEIYAPSAASVRELVSSGKIQPIG
jgi:hypothetical protein